MNNLFPWVWNDGAFKRPVRRFTGPIQCALLNAVNLAIFTATAGLVWNWVT